VRARAAHLLRALQHLHGLETADVQTTHGVTSAQLIILTAVVADPGRDQRALVAATSVDKSTTAEVIARLAGKGLVRPARDGADARKDRILPSPAGIRLVHAATPDIVHANRRILSVLSPDRRSSFMTALRAIAYVGMTTPPTAYLVPSPGDDLPPLEVTDSLARHIRAGMQRYQRIWAATVGRTPTPIQFLTLDVLANSSTECDQQALARAGLLDKATLTEVLSKLERRGLVDRRPSSVDRRRRDVRLTEQGATEWRASSPSVQRTEEEFIAVLTEHEQAHFLAALEDVLHAHGLIGEGADSDLPRNGSVSS
jgi:DNA-binding MarR family transcriptional regulator